MTNSPINPALAALIATDGSAIKDDAEFDKALSLWASPLLQSGDLATLSAGLSKFPPQRTERDEFQLLLARVQAWNGDSEGARARLASLIRNAPAKDSALLLLAHVAMSRADYPDAIARLNALSQSGRQSEQASQLHSALRDLKNFRELQPLTSTKRYRLAIAASLKNEADNIFEWMTFHSLVGVQHFYLYLNDCTDQTLAEIRRFRDQNAVTIHHVDGDFGQRRAHRHYIATYRHQVDWTAFIDGDEYLFPTNGSSVVDAIDALDAENVAGIAVNWLNFGSSGLESKPTGLCIEAFTKRAPDGFSDHYVIKSICKTASILSYPHPHHCTVFGRYVLSDGTPVDPIMGRVPRISGPGLRLNHYFTKSKEQLLAKRERGRPLGKDDSARIRDMQFFALRDRNDVEDLSISRFVEPTKAAMSAERVSAVPSSDSKSLKRFIESDCKLQLWSVDHLLDCYATIRQPHPLFPQQSTDSFKTNEAALRTRLTHQCLNKLRLDSFTAHPAALLFLHRILEWLAPDLYVELGAGVSSLVAADGLKQFSKNARGFSIEENQEHLSTVAIGMSSAGLDKQLQFVHAPIKKLAIGGQQFNWYDSAPVRAAVGEARNERALIFADGPSTANGWDTRLPAPHQLRQYAAPGSVLLLDDAFRSWELRILQNWSAVPGLELLGVIPVGRGLGVVQFI